MDPVIIAAGLNLLGGFFNRRSQKGANDTDLVKLRKEANRSGFHPLTVLRATGGAGFTRGVHGGLSRMGALFSGASRMVSAYNANQRQKVDDAYTTMFRDLQLQGMSQDIKIGAAQLARTQIPFANAFPTAPDNILENDVVPLSIQEVIDVSNIAINSSGQVVTNEAKPFLESRVMPDGTMVYVPQIDDGDSFILQSAVVGGYMFKEGVKDMFTGGWNKKPKLNPTLQVLYPPGQGPLGSINAWGVNNTAKKVGNPFPWLGRTLVDQ